MKIAMSSQKKSTYAKTILLTISGIPGFLKLRLRGEERLKTSLKDVSQIYLHL